MHHLILTNVIILIWAILIILSQFLNIFQSFQSYHNIYSLSFISSHGKRKFNQKKSSVMDLSQISSILRYVLSWEVPKSYFQYMYLMGIWMGSLVFLVVNTRDKISIILSQNYELTFYRNNISIIIFLIQVYRRYWECHNITLYGDSKMHIVGLFVGLFHYSFVPWTLVCDPVRDKVHIVDYIVIIAFLMISWLQYKHHLILYNLKKSKGHTNYTIPMSWMFQYICCPHYFCEILIYLCFYLININSFATLMLLLWVISNLSIVAGQNLAWYRQHFGTQKEFVNHLKNWKCIIPFIW